MLMMIMMMIKGGHAGYDKGNTHQGIIQCSTIVEVHEFCPYEIL